MPFKSKAQAAYFNMHKAELEKQGVNVDEWNKSSKDKSLPEHVKTQRHTTSMHAHSHMRKGR